ncbi:MAG: ATP-binding cassette domain-containing protein [Fuerstiella sp.]|nr:ATP-binding cassette domain-containing protein [Fuerstiella sp.]
MIRVEGLNYICRSAASPPVRELSFDVKQPEAFGFLGHRGAGKTTIKNILIGFIKAWQGRVQILDRLPAEWNVDLYRSIDGSFDTLSQYLKLSVRENLEYFRSLDHGNAEEVLSIVSLDPVPSVPVRRLKPSIFCVATRDRDRNGVLVKWV